MQQSFWQQLDKPIIGLSPMDGVSDHPFRHIQKKYGRPMIVYTEFTSVEGVCHGADRLLKDFLFDETQRPVIGQIYGTTPDYFRQTAIVLCELGFDGVDINMGCPAKNVAHSGAGAALIKTPQLAQEIVAATKQGIREWQNGATVVDCPDITPSIAKQVAERHQQLPVEYQSTRTVPVSIKTRVGFDHHSVDEWIPQLLETEPAAIAIHGRTLKQYYGGQADWSQIGLAKELAKNTTTLILGNGDIQSMEDALQKVTDYGVDGVLIGRSCMGNPFIFDQNLEAHHLQSDLFQIALEHSQLFEDTFMNDGYTTFLPMRKHLGWYVKSVPNASQIRIKVFQASSTQEVKSVFEEFAVI